MKSWNLQAADMAAAAEYLENVGKKALGVMGHSKAGSGALLHAADYGSIPRIANVSGRFDHKRGDTSCTSTWDIAARKRDSWTCTQLEC